MGNMLAEYVENPPTLTDGTSRALRIDSTGALVVTGGGGGGGGGGDASAANQVTGNNSLASIDGKLPASLGAKAVGASFSVVPATSSTWAATQSGAWNVTNITGTISLPTGAATSDAQTTSNNSLSSIDTKLSSQATAANQATANGHLETIAEAVVAAAVSTSSNVSATTSSTQLLAANSGRLGGAIVNHSTAACYVKLGTGASATSFDYFLGGSVDGAPWQMEIPLGYTGAIYAAWGSATGAARISEREAS